MRLPSTTRFSASVKDFSVEGYLEARDARRMDPFIQYGMVAGIQAFRDSGFEVTDANAARIGCAIGSGIGGIGSIEDTAMLGGAKRAQADLALFRAGRHYQYDRRKPLYRCFTTCRAPILRL